MNGLEKRQFNILIPDSCLQSASSNLQSAIGSSPQCLDGLTHADSLSLCLLQSTDGHRPAEGGDGGALSQVCGAGDRSQARGGSAGAGKAGEWARPGRCTAKAGERGGASLRAK